MAVVLAATAVLEICREKKSEEKRNLENLILCRRVDSGICTVGMLESGRE